MFLEKISNYKCSQRFEYHVFLVLIFLLFYLCFEKYVVNLLNFNVASFVIAKYLSEFLVCTLVIIRFHEIAEALGESKVLFLLVVSLLSSISLSVFLSESSLLDNALSARLFLRYFFVFLLSLTLVWGRNRQLVLFVSILFLSFFQVAVAQLQKLSAGFVTNSLLELNRPLSRWVGGAFAQNMRVFKQGAYTGSFNDPTTLSAFLLLSMIVLSAFVLYSKRHHMVCWPLGMILLSYGLFLSHKRMPLLLGVSMSCIILFLLVKKTRKWLVFLLGVGILFVGMNFNAGEVGFKSKLSRETNIPYTLMMQQILSRQYWEKSASVSRLSTLQNVGREYILFGPFLGYGPDQEQVKKSLAKQNPELVYVLGYDGFKDFYWVALLCFYGYPGLLSILSLFMFLSFRYVKYLKTIKKNELSVVLMALLCILATVVYACVVRAFELRIYSYLFWLINGVALSVCMRRKPIDE